MKQLFNLKTCYLLRNVFGGIGFIALLFRWFFVESLNNKWDHYSYYILGFGFLGAIIFEITCYMKKPKNKNHG